MSLAPHRRPAIALLAVLTLGPALFLGLPTGAGTEGPALTDPKPEVSCDARGCDITITAWIEGGQLRSDPLPFRAPSGEIAPIPADPSFGHLLPGEEARALTAWAIGREENSIGVAVEVIDTGVGGPAILVHQTAGFDHVKRAHLVLTVDGGGLVAIKRGVEGPGPEVLSMAPIEGGIALRRVAPDGAVTSETLEWRPGPSGPELAPNP